MKTKMSQLRTLHELCAPSEECVEDHWIVIKNQVVGI